MRKDTLQRTFKVIGLLEKRVSAKEAVKFVEELTPQAEIEQHHMIRRLPVARRPKGSGRPTKKSVETLTNGHK